MLKPGTKIRTLYQYGETGVVARRTKAQRAHDIRYFGSEEKADAWHNIRFDAGGGAVIHRDMLALCNDASA